MGLITEEIEVILHPSNIKYFESLGYYIPRIKRKNYQLSVPKGTKIVVKTNDLKNESQIKIDVKCDNCGNIIHNVLWSNYLRYVKEDGKYYCRSCGTILFGNAKSNITKLKNGISFKQWCIDNNRQDILNRWDYELNNCLPNEILYASNQKHYFKCPRGLHNSELKNISNFTSGQEGSIRCNKCNSFAQWGIDNLGEDFLDKYWDYEKNTVDPWVISYSSRNYIYIKCQEKQYHESYKTRCYYFFNGSRCPYCQNKKVHPLDSLGKLLEDKELLHLWSEKNKESPYKYAPASNKSVYWKCPEGIHENYFRSINSSYYRNFRCPECEYSKGEEKISNYFINLGIMKITDEDYKILDDVFKEKYIYYIPQKKFEGLIGTGNGLLSYDFYLPNLQYNLLIEFQGMQHEKYCKGFHKSKKDFEKQQEHDRRKREYAQNHNINLLEIWYYDYDNIEVILDNYLKQKENNLLKSAIV